MSSQQSVTSSLSELDRIVKETKIYEVTVRGAGGKLQPGIRKRLQIGDRIQKFGPLAAKAARVAAVRLGTETLEKCMEMVPVDTGLLARSAKLTVQGKTYARGKAYVDYDEGGVAIEALTGIDKLHHLSMGGVADADDMDNLARRKFNVFISFNRLSPDKPNVAHWVHENVKPHGTKRAHKKGAAKIYVAKLEGRGGPYLKVPWEEHFAPNLLRRARAELDNMMKYMR